RYFSSEGKMKTFLSTEMDRIIPGPVPAPFLGRLPWLLRFASDPLLALEKLRQQYGDLIRLGINRYSVIVVFDPDLNRHILRDPSVFYSYEPGLIPIPLPQDSSTVHVMTGMPLMNGPRHNDHRTALLPYFHKKFITRYYAGCVDITERKIASWKVGMEVDMRTEMEQLAMWLATEPVLGLDPQREGEAIGRQLERTMKLIFNPFTFLFPYNIPGLPFHRLLKNGEEMERVVKKVIARKKYAGLTGNDILSIMIQMHEENPERLSEQELIGHTTTMFRGGYNPSGMVLYWTIFLLDQHPEALRKVLEELDQFVKGEVPTPEEIERMPHLEGALKETMRLFPAGTWTARFAIQDFELDSHLLPKGTWIMMSPYITHRIPEVFPQPYRFVPERWLSIHPSAYEFMPFSAGPRYCIGTSLAMMQLKIAMSMLLKRYRFSLKPGTKVDCVGLNSIRPKHGLPMILHHPDQKVQPIPFQGNVKKLVVFD
ncbi:MAG TPA: cytochrome P450, partial [Anaerolineales bacterium]|nr:cytochrome P450 [Anaerolineales bacterium]